MATVRFVRSQNPPEYLIFTWSESWGEFWVHNERRKWGKVAFLSDLLGIGREMEVSLLGKTNWVLLLAWPFVNELTNETKILFE